MSATTWGFKSPLEHCKPRTFDDARGQYAFSPKGQWLAYVDAGRRGFENVYVVSVRAAAGTDTDSGFRRMSTRRARTGRSSGCS